MSQNGNAYEDGFVPAFWDPIWAYAAEPTLQTEARLRTAFALDTIRWQYLTGVKDPTVVSPDTWTHDHALVNRPGNPEIQLALFRDYATNPSSYPHVHEWFRGSQVPLVAVWGRNDEIFSPDGARAFSRDLPTAQVLRIRQGHHLRMQTRGLSRCCWVGTRSCSASPGPRCTGSYAIGRVAGHRKYV